MMTVEPPPPEDDADDETEAEAKERAEPPPDARCAPHGNRHPCPRCLADEYGVQVWNSI